MSDVDPSPTSRTWRFIRENVAVTLTVVGLLVYTSLRLSAGIFYGRFGFTPEGVGLGYAEILARSLYTLILLTVYGGILIFATLWLAASVAFAVEGASASLRPRSRPGSGTPWPPTGQRSPSLGSRSSRRRSKRTPWRRGVPFVRATGPFRSRGRLRRPSSRGQTSRVGAA